MGYTLRGIIGRENVVGPIAEVLKSEFVRLTQGYVLLPWTSDAFDALGRSNEAAEVPGLRFCHSMRAGSQVAPVAYVEAECWAGSCEHGAAVFESGQLAWHSEFGPILPPKAGRRTPIGQAFQWIGVQSLGPAIDEFDSIGLQNNRHTEDWLCGGPS